MLRLKPCNRRSFPTKRRVIWVSGIRCMSLGPRCIDIPRDLHQCNCECGQNQHNSTTNFEVRFREIARKIVNGIWTMTTPFMLQPHPAVPSDASFPSKPPRWLWASESAKAAAEVSTNTLGMRKPSWWWCSILGGPHIPTNNMEQLSLVKKGKCWKKVNGQYMSILHPFRVYNWYTVVKYDPTIYDVFYLSWCRISSINSIQKHIKTHRSAASIYNTWPMRTNKNFWEQ